MAIRTVWMAFKAACGLGMVLHGLPWVCAQVPHGELHRASADLSPADEAALRHALEDYDAGRMETAEPVLRRLVVRYPGSYIANEALGGLYAESGGTKRALPFLRHAAELGPREAIAHGNLGAAYLELGQIKDAARELQVAARLDGGNFQTECNLGRALMLLGQPRQAASAYEAANRLRRNDATILFNEALALNAAKQPKEAAALLGQVSPNDSNDEIVSLSGEVAEELGEFQEALIQYQSAARLNPSAQNLYALVVELLKHWTWDEAFTVAQYGEQRYPQDRRFEMTAGVALFAQSKFPQAAAVFAGLLGRDPENAVYADLLGRSCDAATESATVDCDGLAAFARKHPKNAEVAVFAAAKILQQPLDKQDAAEADRLLQQAVVADPKLPEAFYQLGVLAQQRSQWLESKTVLERAVQLRAEYAEAHYRLSRAYAHLGRPDDARREIALQQKYSQDAKDQLNARLQEVVLFLVKPS